MAYRKQIIKFLKVAQEHGWTAASQLLLRSIKQRLWHKWGDRGLLPQASTIHLRAAAKEIKRWSKKPIISIILSATDHPNEELIETTVNSIKDQIYPDWELHIVSSYRSNSDALSDKQLDSEKKAGSRVNYHISGLDDHSASDINSVLERINGDYFCLIDPGDTLSRETFYQVISHIRAHPESDILYSDEEYREESSDRIQPILKPDWSPDYFYSYPYLGNLSVFRTTLVQEIGEFHREHGPTQVYDLVLRLIEHTTKIHHIPHCLYRRAQSPGIIDSMSPQTTVLSQQQQALAAMLKRSGYPGVVETTETPGVWRVRRHLLTHPLVSIVIPSAGKMVETDEGLSCLLETCIDSVQQKSHYRHFEIIVVDGYDIPEAVLSRLKPKIQLVRDNHPFNYSRRINLGVAKAQGDVIILLNDDTAVLSPDWIESMLELAQQEEIGAVGARLLFPDGKIQHTGVVILQDPLGYLSPTHVFYGYDDNHPGYGFSNVANYNYLAVTGACLMMRKQVFEALGGLPEDFPLNYNDVDLCLKAHQAGYRNVVTPYARLSHYGSASRPNRKVALEEKQHFSQIWGAYWAKLGHDPYYNPNFGSGSANFGVKDRQS